MSGDLEKEDVYAALLRLLDKHTGSDNRFFARYATPEGRYYYHDSRTGASFGAELCRAHDAVSHHDHACPLTSGFTVHR